MEPRTDGQTFPGCDLNRAAITSVTEAGPGWLEVLFDPASNYCATERYFLRFRSLDDLSWRGYGASVAPDSRRFLISLGALATAGSCPYQLVIVSWNKTLGQTLGLPTEVAC